MSQEIQGVEKFFYYTKWKFKKNHCWDLDVDGPFHSTWESEQNPKEFLSGVQIENLEYYFIQVFDTKEQMEEYWELHHKPVEVG